MHEYEEQSFDEPLHELIGLEELECESNLPSEQVETIDVYNDNADVPACSTPAKHEIAVVEESADGNVRNDILNDYEAEEISAEDESYIDNSIKEMITDVKDIVAQAKYVITGSPDDGNYEGVSSLIVAGSSLIKELNKSIILKRRSNSALKLEKMKIDSRHKLEKMRMSKGLPNIAGSGNTINIQNNNQQQTNINGSAPGQLMNFSPEEIIKQLAEAEAAAEKHDDDIIDVEE